MESKQVTWVDKAIEMVAALLVLAVTVLVLRSVIGRYLFGASDPYTEELTRLLFPWLIFIGAGIAVRRNANLAVTFLCERLPRRVAQVLSVAILAVSGAFLLVLVAKGFTFSISTWDQVTSALALRKTWFYLSVPAGGLLMFAATMDELIRQVRNLALPSPPREG